jgi:Protein of unknown function (DUF3887)
MSNIRNKKNKDIEQEPPNHFKRNVFLASIPVVGSIIIAIISQIGFNKNDLPTQRTNEDSIARVSLLKAAAGKINQYIISREYDEVRSRMNEGLKPLIPRQLFMDNMDSVENLLGQYTRTLDTSHSMVNNTNIVVVKNKFQGGVHLVQIIFDNNGNIYGLFSNPYIQ